MVTIKRNIIYGLIVVTLLIISVLFVCAYLPKIEKLDVKPNDQLLGHYISPNYGPAHRELREKNATI